MMTPEDRIKALVDHTVSSDDPMYHVQISLFRHWVNVTKMALYDEGIDPDVMIRVLNRITYGTPSGADAHLRISTKNDAIEKLRRGRPTPDYL